MFYFSCEDLFKIANEDFDNISLEGQKLIQCIVEFESNKNCPECKESLKTRGVVCERHYHDYDLCYSPHCLRCVLCHSFNLSYEDSFNDVEVGDRILIKKVFSILNEKRKEFSNAKSESASI